MYVLTFCKRKRKKIRTRVTKMIWGWSRSSSSSSQSISIKLASIFASICSGFMFQILQYLCFSSCGIFGNYKKLICGFLVNIFLKIASIRKKEIYKCRNISNPNIWCQIHHALISNYSLFKHSWNKSMRSLLLMMITMMISMMVMMMMMMITVVMAVLIMH